MQRSAFSAEAQARLEACGRGVAELVVRQVHAVRRHQDAPRLDDGEIVAIEPRREQAFGEIDWAEFKQFIKENDAFDLMHEGKSIRTVIHY